MTSFTNLPSEIRFIIYDHLLKHALIGRRRIAYLVHPETHSWYRAVYGDSVIEASNPGSRYTSAQVYTVNHLGRIVLPIPFSHEPDTGTLRQVVHHADWDELSALSSTCHKIRAEILPLVWPKADIFIGSLGHTFHNYWLRIICHHLSLETCALIRTLHITIAFDGRYLTDLKKTAKSIACRLPGLQHLTVAIEDTPLCNHKYLVDRVLTLTLSLPSSTSVEFLINPDGLGGTGRYIHVQWIQQIQSKCRAMFLQARSIIQKRRFSRTENETRHADGTTLQQTTSLRALALE